MGIRRTALLILCNAVSLLLVNKKGTGLMNQPLARRSATNTGNGRPLESSSGHVFTCKNSSILKHKAAEIPH